MLSREQRQIALSQYSAGTLPSEIARQFGVSSAAIVQLARRAGLPPQRPDLARQTPKRLAWQRKAGEHLSKVRHLCRHEHTENDIELAVPPDTRSITARICGDPLPGRSALDMRNA